MKRDRRPVLITDARQSPKAELRYREIRYVLMMSVRAVCLVVAAILVSARVPLLWLWLPMIRHEAAPLVSKVLFWSSSVWLPPVTSTT